MNDKETSILKNRILELAGRAYDRGIFCFTDFLGLAQQDVFHNCLKDIRHVKHTLFGGTEDCERLMVRFGDPEELGYEEPFPISCLRIEALEAPKPADAAPFSHRDVLGACLNTGITRAALGDIFIRDQQAYLFCTDTVAPMVKDDLVRIRHCMVRCEIFDLSAADPGLLAPTLVPAQCRVSSLRLDAVIAKLYNLPRETGQELFSKNKVFINGRQCINPHNALSDNDIISVRGYGRFIYHGSGGRTKKDKLIVEVEMYKG